MLSQEIWKESFSIPGKGIRGSSDGKTVQYDLSSVLSWDLEYSSVNLQDEGDYAMTVATSGGRFEACDINGEVVWRSEWIDISLFAVVKISLFASETGSGNNTANKYLKAFFATEEGNEIPFSVNGMNAGNWGSVKAEQTDVQAKSIRIVVKMANHYASDKVILDEVQVLADYKQMDPIKKNDVVINEILSNPFPGGDDFVELVNVSEKIVFLDRLYLAARDTGKTLKQISRLTVKAVPLYPGEYVVVTIDTTGVYPWYHVPDRNSFIQMQSFPSFPDDYGEVVLVNDLMEIIDYVPYNKEMHNSFLADPEGVSLERISFFPESGFAGNWISASAVSGYATPGYVNSQVLQAERLRKPEVSFSPDAFSPDNDGYNDEYHISYVMNKPGYLVNVTVFDDQGRYVFPMFRGYTAGTSGILVWNGKDETGWRQPAGLYVILVEIYHEDGQIFRFKDGVFLTYRAD